RGRAWACCPGARARVAAGSAAAADGRDRGRATCRYFTMSCESTRATPSWRCATLVASAICSRDFAVPESVTTPSFVSTEMSASLRPVSEAKAALILPVCTVSVTTLPEPLGVDAVAVELVVAVGELVSPEGAVLGEVAEIEEPAAGGDVVVSDDGVVEAVVLEPEVALEPALRQAVLVDGVSAQ